MGLTSRRVCCLIVSRTVPLDSDLTQPTAELVGREVGSCGKGFPFSFEGSRFKCRMEDKTRLVVLVFLFIFPWTVRILWNS